MTNKSVDKLTKQLTSAVDNFDAEGVTQLSKKLATYIQDNIVTHPKAFVVVLNTSIDRFDYKKVDVLCNKLVKHLESSPTRYPAKQATEILANLRRKRSFTWMAKLADTFIQTGRNEVVIHRQHAQALLDQGYISVALSILQHLEIRCLSENDDKGLNEARGIIGRAYKQSYMNAAMSGKPLGKRHHEMLEKALTAYATVYEKDKKNIWHGVNILALLDRAKRDKVSLETSFPNSTKVAKEIVASIYTKKNKNMWDMASASEACLARENYQEALKWIIKYTKDASQADAFEYASTLRQFEEVWQLDDKNPEQAQILHTLRGELLQQEGGQIKIKNPTLCLATAKTLASDKSFEKILGKDRFKTFQWYQNGLARVSGIAKIRDRSGRGCGSGFLVRGKQLHESLGNEWLIITNAHVMSDDPNELQDIKQPSLATEDVSVCFEAIDRGTVYEVKKILFSSPRSKLDYTIFSLTTPIKHDNTEYPTKKRLPIINKNQRVYIIGHPGGRDISFSMDDNLLLDHEGFKIHYRTPTEGGSSGSPVFNQQWDLIALHHAGGMNMKRLNNKEGNYAANEGISFQSIRLEITSQLAQ